MTTPQLSVPTPVELVQSALDEHGYAIIHDVGGQSSAAELLRRVGELVPQYHDTITHEVTYRPGHEGRAYSQSVNTILAHPEPRGWDPSPSFLPLFCHRQARCGGGHPDLFDVEALLPRLSADEHRLLTDEPVEFAGPGGSVR